jgi:hypothetical protein
MPLEYLVEHDPIDEAPEADPEQDAGMQRQRALDTGHGRPPGARQPQGVGHRDRRILAIAGAVVGRPRAAC